MTPTEQRIHDQKIREAAQSDISDIDALAESKPFNRYFVGQLNRLYRENVDVSLGIGVGGETIEGREKARHRAVFIKELMEMPAKQRQSCENVLRTPIVDPTQPQRPMQVG